MRVLMINVVCGIRSTGRICTDTAAELEAEGHEVKIAYGRESVPEQYRKYAVRIGNDIEINLHGVRSRVLDQHGLGSRAATRRFLAWAEEYDPEILWLHNIHGYYINYELLFDWIKRRPNMQVKWTLHDCWAFTGHCSHFTVAKCDRWKTGCNHCPQTRRYPASFLLDNSKENYARKRKAFTGIKNMTIITPSKWLADLVRQSFLKDYPIEVRYNTVDTEVFRPTPSDFRERHGLENKKIVLGVASVWDDRKGLNDFLQLSDLLNDEYKIVLVGLSPKQIKSLPPKILGLPRTNNTEELAEIYTAADVFVNPSKEETFSLTTAEAISCGTRAIVYKGTACEEIVTDKGGEAIPGQVEALTQAIYGEKKE